jgi:hypothetical protein
MGLEGDGIYIEKHENRFADRNAWSADGGRQHGQLGTTLSRCRAANSAQQKGTNGIVGGMKKTNRTKEEKIAGGKGMGREKLLGSLGNLLRNQKD